MYVYKCALAIHLLLCYDLILLVFGLFAVLYFLPLLLVCTTSTVYKMPEMVMCRVNDVYFLAS